MKRGSASIEAAKSSRSAAVAAPSCSKASARRPTRSLRIMFSRLRSSAGTFQSGSMRMPSAFWAIRP